MNSAKTKIIKLMTEEDELWNLINTDERMSSDVVEKLLKVDVE